MLTTIAVYRYSSIKASSRSKQYCFSSASIDDILKSMPRSHLLISTTMSRRSPFSKVIRVEAAIVESNGLPCLSR
jgi:hypothetical protein